MASSSAAPSVVEYVDPHPGMKGDDEIRSGCVKCSGSGTVNYGNVSFGARVGRNVVTARWCFDCGGRGEIVRKVKNIRAAERRRVREANKAVAAQIEAAAKVEAFVAANPVAAERMRAVRDQVTGNGGASEMAAYEAAREYGGFIVDVAVQSGQRPPSERQVEAWVEAMDRHEAQAAAKVEAAASKRHFGAKGDKVVVRGEVVVATSFESAYGYCAIVVVEGSGEHEGAVFKAMGSGKSLFEVEKGDQVEMSAAIKDHDEYDGVPQTVVTRAKMKAMTAA